MQHSSSSPAPLRTATAVANTLELLAFISSGGTQSLLNAIDATIDANWDKRHTSDDTDSADSAASDDMDSIRPTTQMVLRSLCSDGDDDGDCDSDETERRAALLRAALSYAERNMTALTANTYGDLDVVPPSPPPDAAPATSVRTLEFVLRALALFEEHVAAAAGRRAFASWFDSCGADEHREHGAHLYAKYASCGDPRNADHSVVFYSRLDTANKRRFVDDLLRL